jgi:nitrous oxidase accessory protein
VKSALIISFVFLLASAPCGANSLHVGLNQPFGSIREAIQKAKEKDTIWVHAGLYKEGNISINKAITLIGLNFPVIDGEGQFEILSVRSDGVQIIGLYLKHSGKSSLEDIAALKVYQCKNVLIKGNRIEDAFFGIYLLGSSHCTVDKNNITAYAKSEQQSGNGIHCWKCDSLMINGNQVIGHRDGIYFEFVTNSVICGNHSKQNIRYGLHFMFSHQDEYITNTFENNGAGVSVMFTHGVRMIKNLFEDNWGDGAYGLLLKEISDSYIEGNIFRNNTTGVHMEGASRIKFEKNNFIGNGWAMKIQASCMDIQVSQNNFLGNSFDLGTNGSLVLNRFNHNYWDKYEGYDLNKDNVGDIPYRPVSLFSMIVEKNPSTMMLFRSLMTSLLDRSERLIPSLTPADLKDDYPYMKPVKP